MTLFIHTSRPFQLPAYDSTLISMIYYFIKLYELSALYLFYCFYRFVFIVSIGCDSTAVYCFIQVL